MTFILLSIYLISVFESKSIKELDAVILEGAGHGMLNVCGA